MIAVNGKTLRGSGGNQQPARHLLAALDHAQGVVLGQAGVGTKTNEIPSFIALLDKLDIEAAVISGDALHAQRGHATYLHRRGAHYLLIVKRNQHSLHAQLAALPWRDVPVAYDERERRHGRTERRTLKITSVARGLAFPHASQAIQSFPGLGRRLTARIAGEIGEHIEQFTTPNSLQCYAGSAPVTRRSGKRDLVVAHRLACNRYLADAVHKWAFASLRRSAWAKEFYDSQRACGKSHHADLRGAGESPARNPVALPHPPRAP